MTDERIPQPHRGEPRERRHEMGDVVERLGSIESRLSRIEGGLVLAAFVIGAVIVPILVVAVDHIR